MGKNVKKYILPVFGFALTLVSALFWVALRINHSGISKFLGADTNPSFLVMNLPVMVCVLAWVGCGFSLLGITIWKKRKWATVLGLIIGVISAGAAVAVVMFGAWDYLSFILPHFWESLAVAGGIILFALVLYFPVRGRKWLKAALVAAAVLAAVVLGYELKPCDFSVGPVVYAVEDTYQIVFSTSDSAMVWVEIGGERYYDLYAGSMRSRDGVHKVTVPQSALDAAKGYTVCAKQMIYRGPFGGYTGKTISESYAFRPVDSSDGLDYVSLSDVHSAFEAAKTAATLRENTDFIVLLGDILSMVETEKDAQATSALAHDITGGEIPVIYARGNHEIKGEYGEDFYKYVGSKNQEYYYWVTLGQDVFAVVLDMGEDHEDDWWEYYETAQFDLYRAEQTEFLKDILEEGRYADYSYRMALCHIPIVYVDDAGLFGAFREEWTALLNEMGTDISLSGHQHRLYPFLPDTIEAGTRLTFTEGYSGKVGKTEESWLTDFTFPTYLVGRRSLEQKGGTSSNYDDYTCLYTSVDLEAGLQTSAYYNSRGQMLTGWYPFVGAFDGETFTEITAKLN